MLQLLIPYIIGAALGAEPAAPTAEVAGAEGTASASASAVASAAPVTETAPTPEPTREPEPQVPTGKFTTAIEVRPILDVTKANWAAVRLYNGQDLVYFTGLLSWRCGLWDIRYGINGEAPTQVFEMEPCYLDMAQPNALNDVVNFLPYITLPPESVSSLTVEIRFDDGTTDTATYERAQIQIQ